MAIGVRTVSTITKRHLENQIVCVFAMNDEQKHLLEYKRYEKELEDKISTETIKQYKYWFENRLKSVRNRINAVSDEVKNE